MMRRLCFLLFAALSFVPAASYADIYRYETPTGELLITAQPRNDKGLKLLEVIRDTASNSVRKPKSSNGARTTRVVPEKGAASSGESRPPAKIPATTKEREIAYQPYVEEASQLYGIPVPFIKAVIKIESNFNPRAVSRVGAMGLMQLMPGTAAHMKVNDPFDPRQNILGGTRYLRRLSDKYDGDINLVLSGYNAGPGNVEKAGGIPFEATQAYVRNVYYWYNKYREEAQMASLKR